MLFAFLFKPRPVTAAISLFGVLNWWVWGIIAEGIGC
jgi:hypothetical protein